MELISRKMPKDYTVVDCGDFHSGALNSSREALKQMVERIRKDKKCYVVVKGDAIEAILPNDKRYASCAIDWQNRLVTPIAQADALVELFEPIKDRILVWLIGNHEYKLINTIDIGRYITDKLGIPHAYGSVHAKFTSLDRSGKVQHKMSLHHGYGKVSSNAKDDIQAEANMKAALKLKLVKQGHTDCVYMSMGHIHRPLIVNPTFDKQLMLTDDGERMHQQRRFTVPQDTNYIPPECRWYASSPSFLKCYSPPGSGAISYGEVGMFSPAEIGWLEVAVKGGEIAGINKIVV